MRFTGLSEFLVYGLLFAAIIGFNILKQVLAARRDQQRRQARAGQPLEPVQPAPAMSPLRKRAVQPAPHESLPEIMETTWGRPTEADPHEPVVVLPVVEQPQEVVLARQREQRRQERLSAARQSPALPGPVRARRRLLHNRRDLRHGIVLMTVLGPCRALQPYDQAHD